MAAADNKQPPAKASDDKSAAAGSAAPLNLTAALQAQKEWNRSVVYTAEGKVLANTFGPKDVLESEITYVSAAHNSQLHPHTPTA